jgi:hypothetical protein
LFLFMEFHLITVFLSNFIHSISYIIQMMHISNFDV